MTSSKHQHLCSFYDIVVCDQALCHCLWRSSFIKMIVHHQLRIIRLFCVFAVGLGAGIEIETSLFAMTLDSESCLVTTRMVGGRTSSEAVPFISM